MIMGLGHGAQNVLMSTKPCECLLTSHSIEVRMVLFPAHARQRMGGHKIVLVPPYLYICLSDLVPFIHVVLEECTP